MHSKVTALLQELDNFSDKTIKNSIIGKFYSFVSQKSFFNLQNKSRNNVFLVLLFSLGFLFFSLILPQFSDDRYGIGLIILFIMAIFSIHLFINKGIFISFNSIDFLVFLLFLACIISTASSYFFKESLIGFFKYFLFLSLYIILKTTLLQSSYKIFFGFWILLFIDALLASVFGIYQYFISVEPLATWEDPSIENIHTRVYSTLGNPNLLGGFLLVALPFAFIYPLDKECSIKHKIFFLSGGCLIFLCLLLTGSRGAYIGLIFQMFFCLGILFLHFSRNNFIVSKKRILALIILTIGAISLCTILFPIFTERLLTIFTAREHSSNNYRINVWLSSLNILRDNWLVGIGLGNNTFKEVYGLYMKSTFDAQAAYNVILELCIELGIFGCFVFIAILVISILKLHLLFWVKGNFLAFAIFISLAGLFIHGVVDTVFFRPQIFIPFWFLLAGIAKLETKG